MFRIMMVIRRRWCWGVMVQSITMTNIPVVVVIMLVVTDGCHGGGCADVVLALVVWAESEGDRRYCKLMYALKLAFVYGLQIIWVLKSSWWCLAFVGLWRGRGMCRVTESRHLPSYYVLWFQEDIQKFRTRAANFVLLVW